MLKVDKQKTIDDEDITSFNTERKESKLSKLSNSLIELEKGKNTPKDYINRNIFSYKSN